MNEVIEMLNKAFIIRKILLLNEDEKLHMLWECCGQVENFSVIFHNVSRLFISNLSYPIQISYLEITCNTENGWDYESQYFLHDYEEDHIRFYCQSFCRTEDVRQGMEKYPEPPLESHHS